MSDAQETVTQGKIDSLTPQQEKEMVEVREQWRKIGTCTMPANRPEVEAVISQFYRRLGFEVPQFVWGNSPQECQVLMNKQAGNPENEPKFYSTYFGGMCEAYWVAFYKFCEENVGVKFSDEQSELLDLWARLTKSGFFWWGFDTHCFLSDRPSALHFEENNRLHNESGPAVSFRDGWDLFYLRGISVPRRIVMEPETITVEEIENEQNLELRRLMMERYGKEGVVSFLQDSGAQEIHSDETGTLYKKTLQDDEDLVMVGVVNSTAEPDGTFKKYFIRVPPNMERAKQAVAWTFQKTEAEYNPDMET